LRSIVSLVVPDWGHPDVLVFFVEKKNEKCKVLNST
jgi:hypothetical protein